MMLTPYITQVITPNQKTRKIALALADEFGQVVHLEAVPSRMCIRLIYLLTRRHRKDVPVWSAMLEDRLQREFSCLF